LFKVLHKRGNPNLSVKLTSHFHLQFGLHEHSNIYKFAEPNDKTDLGKFCAWMERYSYERISIMARLSKDGDGDERQDWDTLFLVANADLEEEDGSRNDRNVIWCPYGGAEWRNVVVGAIYGPKVPLLE
jgi:hypothetical protein